MQVHCCLESVIMTGAMKEPLRIGVDLWPSYSVSDPLAFNWVRSCDSELLLRCGISCSLGLADLGPIAHACFCHGVTVHMAISRTPLQFFSMEMR